MSTLSRRIGIGLGAALIAGVLGALVLEVLARTVLWSPLFVPVNSQSEAMKSFAAARMFESWHEQGLSYRGRPHAAVTLYGIEYRHDSLGLRSLEIGAEKAASEFRVLVLGDSNVYGWRVKESETFCSLLQRALALDFASRKIARRVSVIDAGTPGYNSRDEYLRYLSLEEIVKPDLVLLGWYANDCEKYGFQLDSEGFLDFDPLPSPVSWKPLLLRSCAYRWLKERRTVSLRARGEIDIHEPSAFELSTDYVARIQHEVVSGGRTFALLDVPWLEPDEKSQRITVAGYRERRLSDRLAAFAAARGIPYLGLLPAIDGQPVALLWGSIEQNDHHPNAKAHAAFAARILPFLREQHLVP